jgi:hypothetical protein
MVCVCPSGSHTGEDWFHMYNTAAETKKSGARAGLKSWIEEKLTSSGGICAAPRFVRP